MTLLEEMEQRRAKARAPTAASEADIKRGYAVIVSTAMFVVHATLAALARIQYGQEAPVLLVAKEALPSIPIFAALIYFVHPLRSRATQAGAAAASVGVGCWLVYLVNEEGYYASMRRAPALGSLWVWLFIELEWYYGVASLAVVAAYLRLNDYSIM